jgi:hypothetical protein
MFVEPRQKGLKNVDVIMTMFIFIVKFEILAMDIIVSYEVQSTPFSMKHQTKYLTCTIWCILNFL